MSAPNVYDIGDLVRIGLTLLNSAGTLVDPSSLRLQYRMEPEAQSSLSTLVYGVNSIVRAETGVFYHDYSVVSEGTFRWRWEASGANQAAVQGIFRVRSKWGGLA